PGAHFGLWFRRPRFCKFVTRQRRWGPRKCGGDLKPGTPRRHDSSEDCRLAQSWPNLAETKRLGGRSPVLRGGPRSGTQSWRSPGQEGLGSRTDEEVERSVRVL